MHKTHELRLAKRMARLGTETAFEVLVKAKALEAQGRDIAARLGLAGIFKMDFKRRPDGSFCLFEINTRFNLWHYLGAVNGVNLPKVAYQHLTGQKIEKTSFRVRYRWLCLREDWRARHQVGFARWLLSLAYVPKVYDIFAWSDPLPFVRYWAAKLRSAFTRRMHRWLATAS